jgi:hypothetical protein
VTAGKIQAAHRPALLCLQQTDPVRHHQVLQMG